MCPSFPDERYLAAYVGPKDVDSLIDCLEQNNG